MKLLGCTLKPYPNHSTSLRFVSNLCFNELPPKNKFSLCQGYYDGKDISNSVLEREEAEEKGTERGASEPDSKGKGFIH